MKWTPDAEAAIKKVPFFVRKRVKTRVENEAKDAGKKVVSIREVKATKAKYLNSMESEIKGYQLDACFGPSGCPNRAVISDGLVKKLESLLESEDLLGFLKARVKGNLKFHHELRVTIADCPNACSQPQIKDIGIIGASSPGITDESCSMCEACADACKEDAITLNHETSEPEINYEKCIHCGQCVVVCPTGTLAETDKGYRVLLGGKLGRHPQLARELPGMFGEETVLNIVKDCIDFYKKNSLHGKRFAQIFSDAEFDKLSKRYIKRNL